MDLRHDTNLYFFKFYTLATGNRDCSVLLSRRAAYFLSFHPHDHPAKQTVTIPGFQGSNGHAEVPQPPKATQPGGDRTSI